MSDPQKIVLRDEIAALTVERDGLKANVRDWKSEAGRLKGVALRAEDERDEAIRERDATRDELERSQIALVKAIDCRTAAVRDRDTLLEAISTYKTRKEAAHGGPGDLRPLYAAFREIAKRTGYAGGQDGE